MVKLNGAQSPILKKAVAARREIIHIVIIISSLFVLDIIWFAGDGCLQSEICERLPATKQTVSAIIKKFWKLGYLSLTEAENDRRNKIVRFTDTGREYAKNIIPPAANAEIAAMAELEDKDIIEMIRITAMFSNYMKKKFREIKEN